MSSPSVLPPQITPAMIPFIAAETIALHQIVALDLSTSQRVALQDNAAVSVNPAIGLACNDALAGQIVFVAVWGKRRIEGLVGVAAGDFIGTDFTISDPGNPIDFGAGLTSIVFPQTCSVVGIVSETDSTGCEVLIQPWNFIAPAAAGGVTSFKGRTGAVVPAANDYDTTQISGFVDAEVPTTFNTNADYDLAQNPNPLSSLLVFINSEAIPKPGQDRLLVQGTDYSLIAGTHGSNARIHYLVTPTATNSIVCWYRK